MTASPLNSAPIFGPTFSIERMNSARFSGTSSGYTSAILSTNFWENCSGSLSILARRTATLVSSNFPNRASTPTAPKYFISALLKSKVCPSIDTLAIADRISLISTESVKFTATMVPPLKSILNFGPPFMTIDTMPAMISAAERSPARPVLLIKSICVSFNILILYTQTGQGFSGYISTKNGSCDKYRCEHTD